MIRLLILGPLVFYCVDVMIEILKGLLTLDPNTKNPSFLGYKSFRLWYLVNRKANSQWMIIEEITSMYLLRRKIKKGKYELHGTNVPNVG